MQNQIGCDEAVLGEGVMPLWMLMGWIRNGVLLVGSLDSWDEKGGRAVKVTSCRVETPVTHTVLRTGQQIWIVSL